MYIAAEAMSRLVSPYDLPISANPLADILTDTVDFERLVNASMKPFITAAIVRTGRGQVFRHHGITPRC